MSYNKSAPVPAQEKCIYTSLGGNKLISAAVYSWKICTAAAPGVVHSSSQSLQITGNTTLRKNSERICDLCSLASKKIQDFETPHSQEAF